MTVDPYLVILLGAMITLGAMVQATIGFGVAVVAAPFVVVLAPELMPGALLVVGFVLPLVEVTTGSRLVEWRALRWALVARLLTTPLGVLVVARFSATAIAVTVGVMVIVAAIVAAATSRVSSPLSATRSASLDPGLVRTTRRAAAVAGLVSGVTATAASIGGPFLAIVLRHEPAERLRGTLAAFFLAGSLTSLVGLATAGELTGDQVVAGAMWVPFLVAGSALARPVRRRIDAVLLQQLVLGLACVAGIGVIVRAVLLG